MTLRRPRVQKDPPWSFSQFHDALQDARQLQVGGKFDHEFVQSDRHEGCSECGWSERVHGRPSHISCDGCGLAIKVGEGFEGIRSAIYREESLVWTGETFEFYNGDHHIWRPFCSERCENGYDLFHVTDDEEET